MSESRKRAADGEGQPAAKRSCPAPSALARLLGGSVDVSDFMASCWERKPLVVRGALASASPGAGPLCPLALLLAAADIEVGRRDGRSGGCHATGDLLPGFFFVFCFAPVLTGSAKSIAFLVPLI